MTSSSTMLAAILRNPGSASALKLERVPIPQPKAGHVLIRVRAFGLNRSELYTRQGLSGPAVPLPRILGIEAVGTVESALGSESKFKHGDVVATIMGGMGRTFDGGYAEYTLVPEGQVRVVKSIAESIDWKILGALPETFQTAWGSLVESLNLQKDDRLLIRGGTSSVGFAAVAIAKSLGAFVAATTRKSGSEKSLREAGADDVFIDSGSIADEVRKRYPNGFSKILELVGITTTKDSLRCAAPDGAVFCWTGYTGGKFGFDGETPFMPSTDIPPRTSLSKFNSNIATWTKMPFDEYVDAAMQGKMKIPIKEYKLEDIVEAHQAMEESTAVGKIVVLT